MAQSGDASSPSSSPSGSAQKTFLQEKEENPLNVNISSLSEIRVALDDLLCEWLNTDGGFVQEFGQSNLFILIQLLSILLGAVTVAISLKVSFDEGKIYIFGLTILYFVMQMGYWLFQQFLCTHELYHGRKGKKAVLVFTEMKEPSTTYSVTVRDAQTGKEVNKLDKGAEKWIDIKGQVDAATFAKDMIALFQKL